MAEYILNSATVLASTVTDKIAFSRSQYVNLLNIFFLILQQKYENL